jgi:hypothetical protein
VIAAAIENLRHADWTNDKATTGALALSQIMVVTPYNAQVRLLKQRLPDGVRVGTVDKFQGQEAAIVFFSMATSSGQEVPRNVEFLYSRNRLNVAVSRARAWPCSSAAPSCCTSSAARPSRCDSSTRCVASSSSPPDSTSRTPPHRRGDRSGPQRVEPASADEQTR